MMHNTRIPIHHQPGTIVAIDQILLPALVGEHGHRPRPEIDRFDVEGRAAADGAEADVVLPRRLREVDRVFAADLRARRPHADPAGGHGEGEKDEREEGEEMHCFFGESGLVSGWVDKREVDGWKAVLEEKIWVGDGGCWSVLESAVSICV